eukprot:6180332-Pleurochrysis_carterae.AAC.2
MARTAELICCMVRTHVTEETQRDTFAPYLTPAIRSNACRQSISREMPTRLHSKACPVTERDEATQTVSSVHIFIVSL